MCPSELTDPATIHRRCVDRVIELDGDDAQYSAMLRETLVTKCALPTFFQLQAGRPAGWVAGGLASHFSGMNEKYSLFSGPTSGQRKVGLQTMPSGALATRAVQAAHCAWARVKRSGVLYINYCYCMRAGRQL